MLSDTRSPRRFRHPVLIAAVYAIWIGFLCWAGVKFFWWWRFGVTVTETPGPETVWQTFYPELYQSDVLDAKLSADDGYYDVLLLGGSVLEETGPAFERVLRKELGGRFRLFNVAKSAHTSRDSFLKHSRLGPRHFDLVIFYHGINDARMNCCPDNVFRADYSHFGWYCGFQARLAAGRRTLADVVTKSLTEAQTLRPEDGQWKTYGERIKTAGSFRANLEPIVAAAEARGCPIVLMTFAYYIAPNYSDEAYRARKLGYGNGRFMTELGTWGTPKAVKSAIDAHNLVVREVAGQHANVLFVDQKQNMPPDGIHFSDVCHLTERGIDVFVGHVMDAAQRDIERWKGATANSSPRTAVR